LRRFAGAVALLGAIAPTAAGAATCDGLSLRDVAPEAGLDFVHDRGQTPFKHLPETMGAGAAWFDYDGDGWLDLYVVQSGTFPPDGSAGAANRLYRNRGDGRFEDVSAGSGAQDRGYGQGVTAADVNGDGHIDLYVCNFGTDSLLLNRGDGTFRDATAEAGLGLDGWSSAAALGDADGDGDLDLYVTRYLEYDPPEGFFCIDALSGLREYCDPSMFRGASDRYYVNQGDGTFRDATDAAGFAEANGKGMGVVFTDFDDDGRPDVYVTNDVTINLMFRNRGDGTFEDLSLLSGAGLNRQGKAEAGMGVSVGDVDGDLDPDVMVSNFDVETDTLLINHGDWIFEDASAESGFGTPSFNLLGFGVVAADLDLDGDLDAYVTNGHIFENPSRSSVIYAQPDLLMLGDGTGRFSEQKCGPVFDQRLVGRGLAAGDYDNDGDIDLVIVNSGGPLQLLRNEGLDRGWIGFILDGGLPNSEAIGAVATLIDGTRHQARWVMAGDSYQSTSDKRLLFGLGRPSVESSPAVDLEVAWPWGEVTRHPGNRLGRYWRVSRTDGSVREAQFVRDSDVKDNFPAGTPSDEPLPGRVSTLLGLALLAAAVAAMFVVWRRRERARASGK
jgi:hypothetical protein